MPREFRGFAIIAIAAGGSRISDNARRREEIIRDLKLQGDFTKVQDKRRLRSNAERAHYSFATIIDQDLIEQLESMEVNKETVECSYRVKFPFSSFPFSSERPR